VFCRHRYQYTQGYFVCTKCGKRPRKTYRRYRKRIGIIVSIVIAVSIAGFAIYQTLTPTYVTVQIPNFMQLKIPESLSQIQLPNSSVIINKIVKLTSQFQQIINNMENSVSQITKSQQATDPLRGLPIDPMLLAIIIAIVVGVSVVVYFVSKSKKHPYKNRVVERPKPNIDDEPQTPEDALKELRDRIYKEKIQDQSSRSPIHEQTDEPPKVNPKYKKESVTQKGKFEDVRETSSSETASKSSETKNVYDEAEEIRRKQEQERKKRSQEDQYKPREIVKTGFDSYTILGLSNNATCQEVKARYKELIKKNSLHGMLNMSKEQIERITKIQADINKAKDEIMKEKGCGK